MKHNFKKILSIFLVALMCLSVFPVSIFAEDTHAHDYVCPECFTEDQVKVVSEQVEPTCEKAAGVWYRCDNIDGHAKKTPHEFFVQTAVAHHSNPELFKHTAAKDKTCKDDGNYEFWHCEVCKKNYYKNADGAYVAYADGAHIIPADGVAHEWGDWKETSFVCGVSDGEKVRTCGLCGETETVVLTKTEHLWVVEGYKVNGELVKVEDYEPTCLETVTVVVSCGNDGCNVTEEKTGKGWGHHLTHTNAVGATCTENGNVEYWSCSLCGNDYDTATPTFETKPLETVVTLAGHGLTNGKATHTGVCVGTYYECLDCNKFFADEALTDELTADELKAHNEHDLDKVEAKAPTCADFGWIEHYFCDKCDRYYADANAASELDYETQVKLAKTNHISKETVAAVDATCTSAGTISYKVCKFCNGKFAATDADDNLVNVVTDIKQNITVPSLDKDPATGEYIVKDATEEEYNKLSGHQHNWKVTAVKEPNCLLKGYVLWICDSCDEFTAPGTEYHMILDPIAHKNITDANIVEVKPTCVKPGTYKHAFCPDCQKYFGYTADGELNTTVDYADNSAFVDKWVDETAHVVANATHVAASDATCGADGCIEHYICGDCGDYFILDADGKLTETTAAEVVLPKHTQETIAAVAPTSCQVPGNVAYVKCSCGNLYATTDTAFTTPKPLADFADTLDHTYTHVAATVNCKVSGVIEHWVCDYEDCTVGYFLKNEAGEWVNATEDDVTMTWQEYIALHGDDAHEWGQVEGLVACTDNQHTGTPGKITCTVCGTSKAVSQHDFSDEKDVEWLQIPACNKEGKFVRHCDTCGLPERDLVTGELVINTVEKVAHVGQEAGITHVQRVEKECYKNGNIEYWICNTCGEYFLDASCTTPLAKGDEVVPMRHGTATKLAATAAPACGGSYNVEQMQCDDCGHYWLESDPTNVKDTPFTAVMPHIGTLDHVTGKAADCENTGLVEHWQCTECKVCYYDAAATDVVEDADDLIIPKVAHTYTFVGYVAPKCNAKGNWAYYYIDNCDKHDRKHKAKDEYATDESMTQRNPNQLYRNGSEVIDECAHSTTLVPAVKTVCTAIGVVADGNIEYHECQWCKGKFAEANAALGTAELATVVTTHTPNYHFDATRGSNLDPTCTEHGYEFLICSCDFVYYQLKAATGHNVTEWNETTETDCQKDGLLVYYYCASCDKSYAEPECLTEVKNGDKVIRNDADALIREAGKHYVVDADGKIVYLEDDCTKEVNYSACAGCGNKITITHDWVDGENEANCLYPKSTFKICNDCHVVDEDTRVSYGEKDPEAHVYEWEIDVEATCYSVGSKHKYCLICGDHFDKTLTEEIPMVAHDIKTEITTPATCLTPGVLTHDCQVENCPYVKTEEIPTTGHHTMTDWELNPAYNAPNYTVEDAQLRFCSVCKAEDTYEYRAMPDVHFSVSLDNGVVAGAELVNSGKLAVTINMSAYKKEANALQLSFKYSSNLTFDSIVWGEGATAFGYNQGNGVNGVCTLFSMLMVPSDVEINGEDLVYATVYFTIDGAVPTANSKVAITDLTVLEMVEIVLEDDDVDANVLTTVGANAEAGYVTLGDVNNDGEVGLKDIQLMYPALTGQAEYDAQADFDKDGAVTAADFAALQKFFATVYNYEQLINPELRPA